MKRIFTIVGVIGACFILMIYYTGQAFGEETVGKTIKVGGIFDITGPTNAMGAPFADGAKAYFSYVNKKGGIKGMHVDFIGVDYQYNIQKSTSAFSMLTEKENILGLLGWGSVDMPLIIQKAVPIKLPVISAAARGQAVIGKFNPCVFAIAGSYSDEGLTVLAWLKDDAKKRGIDRPKVGMLYSEPNRETAGPIKEGCAKHGVDLAVAEFFSERSITVSAPMARIKEAGCEYVWSYATLSPTCLVFKEAHKIDFHPQFLGTFFTASETLFKLAADTPGKFVTTSPVAFMNQTDVRGIKNILDFTGNPNLPSTFVIGWVGSMVLAKGIEKANITEKMSIAEAKNAILGALETFRNEDMEGITAPMTFKKNDHIGTKGFKLFRADWSKGRFVEIPGDFKPLD